MIDQIRAKLEQVRAARNTLVERQDAERGKFDEAIAKLERHLLSHYLDNNLIDEAVRVYIETRDQKEAVAKQQKEINAGFTFVMNRIESWFLKQFTHSGAKSAGTPFGTAARTTRTQVKVADAEEFFDWVITNDHPEMLEKRASKSAVDAWLEGTSEDGSPNELPPGLSRTVEYAVTITRPRSR